MSDFPSTILKRDATGRVHCSREQREALLDEFERSGLKGAAFVRTVGISYPTFASWIQQRRHGRGDYRHKGERAAAKGPKEPRWIEATMSGSPQPVSSATAPPLRVELPCGSRLLVGDARQADLAARLLQALKPAVSC
jgi:hypothetical protein